MKRIFTFFLCISLFVAAGCAEAPIDDSGYTEVPPRTDVIIDPPTVPDSEQPMNALVTPMVTEDFIGEDGKLLFTQSYPKFQLILSETATKDLIAADLQGRTDSFLASADTIRKQAIEDYRSSNAWTPYFSNVSYVPTRIDQSLLSLSIRHETSSGEVHPSTIAEGVTYDLSTGKTLMLNDILVTNWSGQQLAELICKALEPRADELYGDYRSTIKDLFTGNAGGYTDWYFTSEGLCFPFSPYHIAPYYAGIVTSTVKYEDLSGLLKDEYLPTDIGASGVLSAQRYSEADNKRFSFLAEMSADPDGTQVLIYPDKTVAELSIQVGSLNDGAYTVNYTMFTADCICQGNGIVIRTDLDAADQVLRLSYRTDGKKYSAILVDDGDALRLIYN